LKLLNKIYTENSMTPYTSFWKTHYLPSSWES